MIDISLLRPLLLKGLIESEINSYCTGFRTWIASGSFVVRAINGQKEFDLYTNNQYSFVHTMAFDASKFASASFESIASTSSVEKLPKSFSWNAIKSYYSAFFAAHAILRCFGYVCSQLEKGHINIIQSYAEANGVPGTLKIEGGFYCGSHDSTNEMLRLKKMAKTHEDTWFFFMSCLKKLSSEVLRVRGLTKKKQELSSYLGDLANDICANGHYPKGNLLSLIRNAINYRQKYNAWHPYGKGTPTYEKIDGLISEWHKNDFLISARWKTSKDIQNYFIACTKIVNLCYLIITDILACSRHKANIFDRKPKTLLNFLKVA
jgi:hypothetical protein